MITTVGRFEIDDDPARVDRDAVWRYLSTEVAGGFTGRMIGLWTEAGSALVKGIEFTELPE